MEPCTRRQLLAGSSLLAMSGLATAARADAALIDAAPQDTAPGVTAKLKVLVAGAHPGDPEAGCGGTIARYTDAGHEVVALYLTCGEAGVSGKSHAEAAAIRTAELEKSCALLKARPLLARQLDGQTEVSSAHYKAFRQLIADEKPDVVFTHWPIDSHRDHRACSLLTFDALRSAGRKFALYYYEVNLGDETQNFQPTHYVDITAVEPRKRDACMAHVSQGPAKFYADYFAKMQVFRGMESGFRQAEAFVHLDQSPSGRLPGG
jgi:LmbE family N-acetylglucosaminyl deacetylase